MTCCNTAEEEENGGAGRSAAERRAAGDAGGAEGGAFSFTGFAVESEALDATFAANTALRDSSFEKFAGFASDKPAAFPSRAALPIAGLPAGARATFGDAAAVDVPEGTGSDVVSSALDAAGIDDSSCPLRAAAASTGPSE
jgi:hypothetical protein